MKIYIGVFIVPILMLLDYYLTLKGKILSEKKYGQHIKLESYELNPYLQNDINKIKWFSKRQILNVVTVTIFLLFLALISKSTNIYAPYDFVCGFFIILFSIIIGGHLTNILLFRYAISHPDEINGECHIKHPLTLKHSQYQVFIVLIPLLVLTIKNPSPFIIGGFCSVIFLARTSIRWYKEYLKKQNQKSI